MADGAAMSAGAPRRYLRAEVTDNAELSGGHYLLGFRTEQPLKPRPGQFFMVGTGERFDPLLKRPFCFLRKEKDSVNILYRVRGRGTELLSRKRPGSEIDVLGPLGNAWPRPGAGKSPLIVAGGVGIASTFPLAARLGDRAVVLYGARSAEELLLLDGLRALGAELHLATEDGSVGTKGTVMNALGDLDPGEGHVIYACGPRGMLRAVAEFAKHRGIAGHVSLEERMACGMGACLGCAVKTTKGYRGVCSDGPVFRIEDIDWGACG